MLPRSGPSGSRTTPRPVCLRQTVTSVEQRWFVGAHANVGGGCLSDLLAQIPLRWIMKKASLHGLTFRSDVEIDGDVLDAPISDSYKEFMKGAYSKVSARYYRTIGAGPEVDRGLARVRPNETIDDPVFERRRKDAAYRPSNLAEWAKRRNVDPANLSTCCSSG